MNSVKEVEREIADLRIRLRNMERLMQQQALTTEQTSPAGKQGQQAQTVTIQGRTYRIDGSGDAILRAIESFRLGATLDNTQTVYSSTQSDRPRTTWRKSASDTKAAAETADGETLAILRFQGVDDGGNFDNGFNIEITQDGASGSKVPTKVAFNTYDSNSKNSNQLVLYKSGIVSFSDKSGVSPLGGKIIRLINKTGFASVKGTVMKTSTTTDDACGLTSGDDTESIGIVYEGGIADGSAMWVVVQGIADVAMKDNTTATHGNWVKMSSEAGYADATNAVPPGGGIPELDQHMLEIGHCNETVTAGGGGTHILARCVLHFN